MSSARLSTALADGVLTPPARGRVLCVGVTDAAALADLSADAATLHLVQPIQPFHDALADAGHDVSPGFPDDAAGFDMAYVVLPRARSRARDWVARSAALLRADGVLVVDGAKTDGVDSLFRAFRTRLGSAESLTKAHGRLFWGRPGTDRFEDWREGPGDVEGFVTGPGLFSAGHVDPGSAALAAMLPATMPPQLADFGAGWGYLSAQVLARRGPARLHLVEADHAAVEAARANIADPRASFHWADVTAWTPPAPLDGVVMNPPFHTGRAATPDLGRAFLARAAESLAAQGQLWLVANRHLPYEADLNRLFSQWREIGGTAAFKLIHAVGPRRARKGHRA